MMYSDWRSQIFERKKNGDPNFGPAGLNQAQNKVFRHFLEFGSLVFLEIVYSDSLQQCLTSTRGENYEKRFGTQIGPNESKLRFSQFSQVWFISFT